MPRYTLEAIVVALLILWLLGAAITPVGGNLIHMLLVIIAAVVVLRLMQVRRLLDWPRDAVRIGGAVSWGN